LLEQAVVAVVDDDESVRKALASLLRSLGVSVCTFGSAGDFLASPRRVEAACLIVDVQMPGMGGIELQERLIALGQQVPIIFITAHPDAKLRERALAAGAVAFLSKPFAPQELIRCTEDALRGAS
jgi:FixJ family two-component response regulator